MNTSIGILYRDAANYKAFCEVVLTGEFTPELEERAREALIDGECFVPTAVGLPVEVFTDNYDDDPDYAEFGEMEPTDKTPTVKMTVAELVERMEKAAEDGWEKAMEVFSGLRMGYPNPGFTHSRTPNKTLRIEPKEVA